ncbi:MAG: hypothetical protein L0H73_06150 [Nitrococcus sp.]|nr:hypothetical protein [Nitrococcus sp.]
MAEIMRRCDRCGKDHQIKEGRASGLMCATGHYLCYKCSMRSFWGALLSVLNPIDWIKSTVDPYFAQGVKKCPLCNAKTRGLSKADLAVT